MFLFQNNTGDKLTLDDQSGNKITLERDAKVVLDDFFRKYVPEFLRPIRQEPPTDYIELTSKPFDPTVGQWYLDANKKKLYISAIDYASGPGQSVYGMVQSSSNVFIGNKTTFTSDKITIPNQIYWKEVAEQSGKDWLWVDEEVKAPPNVSLPSIGELGKLGNRKLNI